MREFASVKSSLLFSHIYWLLIIFRHESSERLCGPGAAGGDVGADQCASASVRLSRGRGGGSGGSGLPQRPACSWLQVHIEQDRGHQGHGYGASVGPFLVQGVANWIDAKFKNAQTDDYLYSFLSFFVSSSAESKHLHKINKTKTNFFSILHLTCFSLQITHSFRTLSLMETARSCWKLNCCRQSVTYWTPRPSPTAQSGPKR